VKPNRFCLAALLSVGLSLAANAQVKVDVIKNPYGGSRNVPELSTNPDYIHAAGLERLINEWGGELLRPIQDVRLDAEQERQYGEWNRMALANANFADRVREGLQDDLITIGLEANCNDLLGMLAGLKYDSEGNARRVGLGGVRDLDPLEADRFDEYEVQQFSVQDIRELSANLKEQMDKLADRVDVVYVHIDMDVLDPAEVPGHNLTVADGPSSKDLAAAMTLMFENPKTIALGIASTPSFNLDPDGVSRQAALNLIEGAIKGTQAR